MLPHDLSPRESRPFSRRDKNTVIICKRCDVGRSACQFGPSDALLLQAFHVFARSLFYHCPCLMSKASTSLPLHHSHYALRDVGQQTSYVKTVGLQRDICAGETKCLRAEREMHTLKEMH